MTCSVRACWELSAGKGVDFDRGKSMLMSVLGRAGVVFLVVSIALLGATVFCVVVDKIGADLGVIKFCVFSGSIVFCVAVALVDGSN
ncbi:hypothetical protein BAZMOX_04184_3 [methanotrophic endosymbiont of Bathymodiolus azoricus (Menez Gwen)]|nr:hypothetical protein BAZMOX_04184_3 [methanotrophic endosymbiont of Bathymodiolus azoricus (Menez Gwen)]